MVSLDFLFGDHCLRTTLRLCKPVGMVSKVISCSSGLAFRRGLSDGLMHIKDGSDLVGNGVLVWFEVDVFSDVPFEESYNMIVQDGGG